MEEEKDYGSIPKDEESPNGSFIVIPHSGVDDTMPISIGPPGSRLKRNAQIEYNRKLVNQAWESSRSKLLFAGKL